MFRIIAVAFLLCVVSLAEGGRIKRADNRTTVAPQYATPIKAPAHVHFSNNSNTTTSGAAFVTNTAMPIIDAAPATYNLRGATETASTGRPELRHLNKNNKKRNPKISSSLHARLMRHADESLNRQKHKQIKHFAEHPYGRQPPLPVDYQYNKGKNAMQKKHHHHQQQQQPQQQQQGQQKKDEEQLKLPFVEIESTCVRDTAKGERLISQLIEDSMDGYLSAVSIEKSDGGPATDWKCETKARLLYEKLREQEPQTHNTYKREITELEKMYDTNAKHSGDPFESYKKPIEQKLLATYDEALECAYELQNIYDALVQLYDF